MAFKACEINPSRQIFARILPGSDLLPAIEEICLKHRIKSASIGTCIGSLKHLSYVYAIPEPSSFFKIKYSEPLKLDGIFEFVGAQGFIALDDAGRHQIHLHAHLSDEHKALYSGHLVQEDNIVLATIEILITDLGDAPLKRNYHQESGFYFLEPIIEE
ncbi:MAG: hypothetical protein AVO33_11025 [delta proteobacterium ML8_F1]|nr:MAG: hypothetical protein AVO33_11025 [delta proteobacterium ML8_F1]